MNLLTNKEYALLTWAETQAKDSLGAHVGGPNEATHRDKLKELRKVLRKVLLKVKHGCPPDEVRRSTRKAKEPEPYRYDEE